MAELPAVRLLSTKEELVWPGITAPFLSHMKLRGPEPLTEMVKVAVSPTQRIWDCNGVAVSGCRRTITEKAQEVMLPLASRAVHVTRLVPCGNVLPDGGTHVRVTPGQLSETVGLYVAIGVQVPLLPSTMMSPGHVSAGRSESWITMRKLQEAMLPLESAALQVTTLVPTGIIEPLGGLQDRVAPGQLSRTVAE